MVVRTRQTNWAALCKAVEPEPEKPPVVYRFGEKKEFVDNKNGGAYE